MGPVHYLYLSFPKDVHTVSLGGIELLVGWSYSLDDSSHVSNMLAVVSFGERKMFLGGLAGWWKMCLVLLSRYVGGVEGPTEADLRRSWTAVCSHTPHEMVECWE